MKEKGTKATPEQELEFFNKQELMVQFGQRLRQVRKALKLNQKDFAETVGIAGSYMSEMESGKVGPGFEYLYRLSKVYAINPFFLFLGEGPEFLPSEDEEKASPVKGIGSRDFGHHTKDVGKLLDYMVQSEVVLFEILKQFKLFEFKNREVIKEQIAEYRSEQEQATKERAAREHAENEKE